MISKAISVVVAARNESAHLFEALTSILMQDFIDFEVIYIDDHSTDHSIEIAKKLAKIYSNLRVVVNPKRGKCSAFNFGVSITNARFVCIFAGDDIMPNGSLRERYEAVANESDEICVVGVSKLITMSKIKKFDGHLIPRGKGRGALSGVSPMMNRRAVKIIFPTPEELPNEDTWMELAVLHMPNWRVIHSDVICCRWRVHSGNSVNMLVPFEEFNNKITIRMNAMKFFINRFGDELDNEQRVALLNKINLEEVRRRGDWLGVLKSSCDLVDRLRALSATNALMYEIRKRLYGLLSGW